MSHQAVTWAMEDAPMLLTDKGKPDTTARHVLQVLAEHAHPDGGGARPAVMRIQYRTGYDRRTVQRALRRLEDGNLIAPEGVVNGCTEWRLALKLKRPASDWAALEVEEVRQREADAERQRRSRLKRVTHADDVTVTDADSVTEPDVTHADDVSHALCVPTSRTQNPDVTDGTPPEPSIEPPGEPSLSPPPPQPSQPAPVADERETFAKAMNDDTTKVAEAWSVARGGRRNPAAEDRVRASAASLLAVGWSIPDLIALAEDMAAKYPAGTDLAKHEAHWSAQQQPGTVRLRPWCGCGGNPAAEFNGKFRTDNGTATGQPCLICHPDAMQESA